MKSTFRAFAFAFAFASMTIVFPSQAADTFIMPGDLIYKHAKLEAACEKCHLKFDKKAQSGLCADCHKEIGRDFAEKRGFHGRLEAGKECKECHPDHKGRYALAVSFDKEKFNHAQTDYPLNDAHAAPEVTCEKCHQAGRKYSEAPSICNECHKKGDKHKGMMGTDCERCHSEKNWNKVVYDHDKTAYKLLGRHNAVKCFKCHQDNNYKDTPRLCNTCHKKDDIHKGRLGTRCEECHVEKNWKESQFDHDRKSTYPLLFKHKQVKCESCHRDDKYKNTPKLCSSCHKKDDKHKGIFGSGCENCHVEKDWKETLFDHDIKSTYPLLFKHKQVKCEGCHKIDWTKGKLTAVCVSCHQKNDKHKGIFGSGCENCHNEKDWKESLFDHDRKSTYPLLFKHKQVKCESCHKSDWIKGKLTAACVSCHHKDDKHKGNFGPKCEMCHVEKDWKEIIFDHDRHTKSPLLGKHKQVKCMECHVSGRLTDKMPLLCFYCHEKDDRHKRKYGPVCDTCHVEKNWKEIIFFDHYKETGYRLLGKHGGLRCENCHKVRIYEDEHFRKDCIYCHKKDDVHKGKDGKNCEECHTEMAWKQIIGKKPK